MKFWRKVINFKRLQKDETPVTFREKWRLNLNLSALLMKRCTLL
jgi:hypothetical protein